MNFPGSLECKHIFYAKLCLKAFLKSSLTSYQIKKNFLNLTFEVLPTVGHFAFLIIFSLLFMSFLSPLFKKNNWRILESTMHWKHNLKIPYHN